MSRKNLLRAGPPCSRECANREPLREAVEAALGCGGVGCVKVRRVGGPGSGARGLFRVEMTWAAPGRGGAGGCSGPGRRGLLRVEAAWTAPGRGRERRGPGLRFLSRGAYFQKCPPGTAGGVFGHRGSRFLEMLPPQPAFFIPEPTSPKRAAALLPAPPQGESAIQKTAALFCGGASRTGLCRRARPRQAAGSFGTRPIKNRGGSKSEKFTPAPGACRSLQTDLRCARQPSARYLMSMPPKTQLALR